MKSLLAPLPSSSSTGGETDAGTAPSSVQKSLIDAVKRGHVEKVHVHVYPYMYMFMYMYMHI